MFNQLSWRLIELKNYKEFIDLLNTEEYKAKKYEHVYHQELEQVFDFGVITLFDDLINELGRVPSKSEYVEAGTIRAEKFFKNKTIYLYKLKRNHDFEWDDKLKKAVQYRLARTYISYLIEKQVMLFAKEHYDIKIASNQLIDQTFGVDLAIKLDKKLYYIHITKDTQYSHNLIEEKGNRKCYIMANNKKHYWTRDWKAGHHKLLYDNIDSYKMQSVNGNVIFNEEFLEKYFRDLFKNGEYDLANKNAEIYKFIMFLKKNGIKQ